MTARKAGQPDSARGQRARVCGIACVAVQCLLAGALVYAYAGVGCYLGVILMAILMATLGSAAVVLLVISAWLRPAELVWMLIATLLISFAAGLAFQLLPAVVCGYSG